MLQLELAGYLGPQTVQATLLEKMPETMRKDVEKLLGEAGGTRTQPSRFTRREQARRAAGQGTASASSGDAATATGVTSSGAAQQDAAPVRMSFASVYTIALSGLGVAIGFMFFISV
jgi:hypothetical protein